MFEEGEAAPVRRIVFFPPAGELAVESVVFGRAFWRRCMGLMGSRPLGRGRGLFLAPCSAVHTMFMRYDLDLIFISRDFRVVSVSSRVAPWRAAFGGRGAAGVLELQSGWFPCAALAPGTPCKFIPDTPLPPPTHLSAGGEEFRKVSRKGAKGAKYERKEIFLR